MTIDEIFEYSSRLCILGIISYIVYNYMNGFYKKESYIEIIKYFGVFLVGHIFLKSFLGTEHHLSFEQTTMQVENGIYRVGAWVFHFESIAKCAEGLSNLISTSVVGSTTASVAVLLAAMMFHSRMLMGGWRGSTEVLEAFFLSLVTFLCLAYFDVFFNAMVTFLDDMSNRLFGDDMYSRYAETMAPMSLLLEKSDLNNTSIFNLEKSISNFFASFYWLVLFLFSCVNLLLYCIQYLSLMGLPIITIIFTFLSGIDPFRPIRICGAIVLLTVMSKLQIFFLASVAKWTIGDYSGQIADMTNDVMDGFGFVGDNFFLLLKLVGSFIVFILIVAFVSWKMVDFILNIIGVNQFNNYKAMFKKGG